MTVAAWAQMLKWKIAFFAFFIFSLHLDWRKSLMKLWNDPDFFIFIKSWVFSSFSHVFFDEIYEKLHFVLIKFVVIHHWSTHNFRLSQNTTAVLTASELPDKNDRFGHKINKLRIFGNSGKFFLGILVHRALIWKGVKKDHCTCCLNTL